MDMVDNKNELKLSIIVPCFNEHAFIGKCIDSILCGLRELHAEIIIVDGGSNDGTLGVLDCFQRTHPLTVRVLRNEQRYQVYALNMAINAARGTFVVRCDAHSIYPQTYFKDILDFYERDSLGLYGNIGFPFKTSVENGRGMAAGIGMAMSSKLGVGGSHRTIHPASLPEDVDTLLFGAWRREVFDKVGLFDTSFIRGQDYEHNLRLRRQGFRVAIIRGAHFTYFTRVSFRKMRRMIFQYAYVKGQLARRDHLLPNMRSFIPLGFWLLLIFTAILTPMTSGAIAAGYAVIILTVALCRLSKASFLGVLGMTFAIPQMHVMHAAGFLLGLLSDPRQQTFIHKAGHTR